VGAGRTQTFALVLYDMRWDDSETSGLVLPERLPDLHLRLRSLRHHQYYQTNHHTPDA